MRIMAVDLGDARTGLAVSDLLGMLCGEAWTVKEWNMERMADLICEEAEKRGVERIVLMREQVSRGSAGEYQADERAGVARLSWRVSGR